MLFGLILPTSLERIPLRQRHWHTPIPPYSTLRYSNLNSETKQHDPLYDIIRVNQSNWLKG